MSADADKGLDRTPKPRDSDQKYKRKRKPATLPKVSQFILGYYRTGANDNNHIPLTG